MNRRGFFATLLAPIVARCVPPLGVFQKRGITLAELNEAYSSAMFGSHLPDVVFVSSPLFERLSGYPEHYDGGQMISHALSREDWGEDS